MKPRFVEYYMDLAKRAAQMSYARRLKVGAVAVRDRCIISDSWNGTPSGMDNNCEIENSDGTLTTKSIVLHAEENVILKAAARGQATKGATLFITHAPCIQCAKLIYGAEFSEVIYDTMYRSEEGLDFLRQVGVRVSKYSDIVKSIIMKTPTDDTSTKLNMLMLEALKEVDNEDDREDPSEHPLEKAIKKAIESPTVVLVNPLEEFANNIPPPSPMEPTSSYVEKPPRLMSTPLNNDKLKNEPLLSSAWNFITNQYPNGEVDLYFLKATGMTASQFEDRYNFIMESGEVEDLDPRLLEIIMNGFDEKLKDYYKLRESPRDSREYLYFLRHVSDFVYSKYAKDYDMENYGDKITVSLVYNFDADNFYKVYYLINLDKVHGDISNITAQVNKGGIVWVDQIPHSGGWIPDVLSNSLAYFINSNIIEVNNEIKE